MSFNPENYKEKQECLSVEIHSPKVISQNELREMGMAKYVYIKPISYETLIDWTQGTIELDQSSNYFALFAADGTPVIVSDDHSAALNEAKERELQLMQLH